MDLDLRKLRYFVVVADTLHFGRAADELHIAQPALSRQIRALEHDLGTPLFTRDSHGVALTDAGRQLLTDAGPLLASAHADRRPDVLVDMQRIEGDDQATMLLDGRIDVGYVRLPIDEAGLRVTPLYTEPRVAVLPAGHQLAGKEQITEADLAGEPLVWHGDTSTQPTRRPHPNAGYLVRGVDETLQHVAAGRGISFLARSATVFYSHPDISYVPIPDLAPDQVCLAMAATRTSPLVDDFFTAAQG